jgi:hypothetical protein
MDALLPPADFATRFRVPTVPLPAGTWWRLARIERKPLDWDGRPGASRFVSSRDDYQVLYLAADRETAFWEVFAKRLLPLVPEERVLPREVRAERRWVEFSVPPGLRVFDSTDIAAVRALGGAKSSFQGEWEVAQAWGEALWLHPSGPDGILYRSDKNDQWCVALFRRAEHKRLAAIKAKAGGNLGRDAEFFRDLRRAGAIA